MLRRYSIVTNVDRKVSAGHGKDHRCGVGTCHPHCIQSWANIKAYTAALSILYILHCIYFSYSIGVIRTVEKRFGFPSYKTGFIMSTTDIAQTILVVLVGYVGRKTHKPRYLSISAMFSTLGLFLAASPYFIYGPYQYDTVALTSSSTSNHSESETNIQINPFGSSDKQKNIDYQICKADASNAGNESVCDTGQSESASEANMIAFYLFMCASVCMGIGISGLMTLGISFIDENVSKEDSAVYIGITTGMTAWGPIIGFPLAAFCTRLPEDLGDPAVSPYNPAFIGCWWLGHVIVGSLMAVFLIPMFFFPKHFRAYYVYCKTTPKHLGGTAPTTLGKELKEFPKSLWKLISNPALMLLGMSEVCCMYYVIGVLINQTRYLEVHFGQPAFVANIATAICGALTGAAGNIIGGVMIKTLKLNERGSAMMFVGAVGTVLVGLLVMIALGCPQAPSAYEGVRPITEFGYDINVNCSLNCGCSRDRYQPVCTPEGVEYFSPCHAGCSNPYTNATSNCACLSDNASPLSSDWCGRSCQLFVPYVLTDGVMSFLASMSGVPLTILIFRLVEPEMKAFALGILSFLINVLGFVPGPILFGALFDSACLLWKTSCGERMSCLVYDTAKYRYYMHGVGIAFMSIALLLAIAFYFVVARKFSTDKETTQNELPEKGRMTSITEEEASNTSESRDEMT